MSFRLVKENDGKVVNSESIEVNNQDDFVIDRGIFKENPEVLTKEITDTQLGEDFLIHQEDVKQDDSEEDEQYDEPGDDIFFKEEQQQPKNEMTYEEIQQKKSHYLYQLTRLRKRGVESSRRFGMEHSLEEIRGEVFRLQKEIDMDNSIDYCRQGLMFCVSTIEMLNGQYNTGGKLTGWSQSVMGNIESYDEVFEELYDKYYTSVKMAPEIKLISMVAGSAFMFHLQKSLLNNETLAPRQREMEGPRINTEELFEELNREVDLDDISSIASSEKSIKIVQRDEEDSKKTIPLKKRGRPKTKK
jgi:hypothetical protein